MLTDCIAKHIGVNNKVWRVILDADSTLYLLVLNALYFLRFVYIALEYL